MGEDCGINLSETACCQSRKSFQVHPPAHSSKSWQVILSRRWRVHMMILGFIWWLLCLGEWPLLSSRLLILSRLKKWDSIDIWQAPACLFCVFLMRLKRKRWKWIQHVFCQLSLGLLLQRVVWSLSYREQIHCCSQHPGVPPVATGGTPILFRALASGKTYVLTEEAVGPFTSSKQNEIPALDTSIFNSFILS